MKGESKELIVPIDFAPASARTMPWSLEAEQSVLGGCLLHCAAWTDIATICSPSDFYHPVHESIAKAMERLSSVSKPIDPVTVIEQMRINDELHVLRAHGGETYFSELTSAVVTVENIGWHAKIVRARSVRRQWIVTAQEIAASGYTSSVDDVEFAERAELILSRMSRSSTKEVYRHVADVMRDSTRIVEARYSAQQVVTGVPTGFEVLDELTGGLQPGHLIIVAGRPKMGKSALAMSVAEHAACGTNIIGEQVPVLVFSFEMKDNELGLRMIASNGSIDAMRIRSGQLSATDWRRFAVSSAKIANSPMHIFDHSATFAKIRAQARRWRLRDTNDNKPAMIIVDYLGLIDSDPDTTRKNGTREREVAEWSRGFKTLARELAVPVVLLAQLNRQVESRQDKRPVMSDLRESGALEADADLVLLIYRDEVYHPNTKAEGIAEIIVGANRHGPAGTLFMRFDSEYVRFSDLPAQYAPPPSIPTTEKPAPPQRSYRTIDFPTGEEIE